MPSPAVVHGEKLHAELTHIKELGLFLHFSVCLGFFFLSTPGVWKPILHPGWTEAACMSLLLQRYSRSDSSHSWTACPITTRRTALRYAKPRREKKERRSGRQTTQIGVWLFIPLFRFSKATCSFINNWSRTLTCPRGTGQRVPVLAQPLHQCCWW